MDEAATIMARIEADLATLAKLNAQMGDLPALQNGPSLPGEFVWNGNTYSGLRAVAWRLVNALWTRNPRLASFAELALPVWRDHNPLVADAGTVGSARRDANKFFEAHRIPWRVQTSGGTVFLKNTPSGNLLAPCPLVARDTP